MKKASDGKEEDAGEGFYCRVRLPHVELGGSGERVHMSMEQLQLVAAYQSMGQASPCLQCGSVQLWQLQLQQTCLSSTVRPFGRWEKPPSDVMLTQLVCDHLLSPGRFQPTWTLGMRPFALLESSEVTPWYKFQGVKLQVKCRPLQDSCFTWIPRNVKPPCVKPPWRKGECPHCKIWRLHVRCQKSSHRCEDLGIFCWSISWWQEVWFLHGAGMHWALRELSDAQNKQKGIFLDFLSNFTGPVTLWLFHFLIKQIYVCVAVGMALTFHSWTWPSRTPVKEPSKRVALPNERGGTITLLGDTYTDFILKAVHM